MDRKAFLSTKFVRLVAFLWLVVFPILFIALPTLEMATGDRERDLGPLWGFIVWILGPLAGGILMKWFGFTSKATDE